MKTYRSFLSLSLSFSRSVPISFLCFEVSGIDIVDRRPREIINFRLSRTRATAARILRHYLPIIVPPPQPSDEFLPARFLVRRNECFRDD